MADNPLARAGRYARTLRYLRWEQWLGRLWNLRPLRVDTRVGDVRLRTPTRTARFLDWRSPRIVGDRYQNQNLSLALDADDFWTATDRPRLWLYQLHYHDFLNCTPALTAVQAQALLATWVSAQPLGARPGWEPYPLSRRLLNWCKWIARGRTFPGSLARSLVLQTRVLRDRLEYHLMGNHLLANGIALVAVGMVLDGEEGAAAARRGAAIVRRELREQTLADGGNYERSPMYHCIVLEDLLDLLELDLAFGAVLDASLRDQLADVAARMLAFLPSVIHDDETIGLFNDAAFGECATPGALLRQGERLGLAVPAAWTSAGTAPEFSFAAASGFGRARGAGWNLLLDAGAIGPDYLPGHAHCDMLSFELADAAGVLITDTGTSTYEVCPRRQHERGTAAHNTVVVPGLEQSEVWGGFRVGRRARVRVLASGPMSLRASHDGYAAAGLTHEREFEFSAAAIRLNDRLAGGVGAALFHLRPGLGCEPCGAGFRVVDAAGNERLRLVFDGATAVTLEDYHFAPEFNRLEPACRIRAAFGERLSTHILPTCGGSNMHSG